MKNLNYKTKLLGIALLLFGITLNQVYAQQKTAYENQYV